MPLAGVPVFALLFRQDGAIANSDYKVLKVAQQALEIRNRPGQPLLGGRGVQSSAFRATDMSGWRRGAPRWPPKRMPTGAADFGKLSP